MALVARDIIDAARDFHPGFHQHDFSSAMLLRQLYRIEKSLFEQVVKLDEEALATNKVVAKGLITAAMRTESGVSLPPHYLVLSAKVRYKDRDETSQIEFIDYRQTEAYFPSASIVGQRLHPFPSEEWDSPAVKDVLVRYVPLPERYTALTDELAIPEAAEEALVQGLAAFMARRGNLAMELPGIFEYAAAAASSFLAQIAEQDMTSLWTVRKVV